MPSPIHQIIFDKMQIPRLGSVLDLTVSRQKLLTENVANAETPGYKRKDIDFRAELKQAMTNNTSATMKTTRSRHIGPQPGRHTPKILTEDVRPGEEYGVDIDQEMAQVAQNQIEYNIAARLIRGRFDGLRTAIRGRR